jgi:hypothetical protein
MSYIACVVSFFVAIFVTTNSFAQPANPLVKPSALPTPMLVNPAAAPSAPMPSPVLQNAQTSSFQAAPEKDESLSVQGLFVSAVLDDSAILRAPIVSALGQPGQPALAFSSMNAAQNQPQNQLQQGANQVQKFVVYRVKNGEILSLNDGARLLAKVEQGRVTLFSTRDKKTSRVVFSSSVESTNQSPVFNEQMLLKSDSKSNRQIKSSNPGAAPSLPGVPPFQGAN